VDGSGAADEGAGAADVGVAAVSFADDMMKSASHASPVDSGDKRQ